MPKRRSKNETLLNRNPAMGGVADEPIPHQSYKTWSPSRSEAIRVRIIEALAWGDYDASEGHWEGAARILGINISDLT